MIDISFLKSGLFYLLISLINGIIVIAITTLTANSLEVSKIGQIDFLINLSNLLITFVHFGSSTFIAQKKHIGILNQYQIYNLGINVILINSILLFFLYILIPINISSLDSFFVLSYVILLSIVSFYLSYCQLNNLKLRYSIISIFVSFSNLLILYSLKSSFDFYNLRLNSLILVYSIVSIYIFFKEFMFFKKFTEIKYRHFKKGIIYGKHLFVSSIASILTERFDRFFIYFFLGSTLNGYYSTMYQFGSIMLVVQAAISKAWLPTLKDKSYDELKNTIKIINFSMLIISLIISVISIFYIKMFLPINFLNYWPIILIISISYYLDGLFKIYNGFLIINVDYKSYQNLNLIGAITNIFLSIVLVYFIGIYGPAIATLTSFLIPLILIKKKFKIYEF